MKNKPVVCNQCGAKLIDYSCEYCGTIYEFPKQKIEQLYLPHPCKHASYVLVNHANKNIN